MDGQILEPISENPTILMAFKVALFVGSLELAYWKVKLSLIYFFRHLLLLEDDFRLWNVVF